MTDSFHLTFTNAETDLFLHLKQMPNSSGFLKDCIKSHMNNPTVEESSIVTMDIDSKVKEIFNRVFGDIFTDYKGEYGFIRVMNECQADISETMKGRKDQVKRICNGDMFLHDSVMEYSREHLPKLGRFL